jgi:hypothetical protein
MFYEVFYSPFPFHIEFDWLVWKNHFLTSFSFSHFILIFSLHSHFLTSFSFSHCILTFSNLFSFSHFILIFLLHSHFLTSFSFSHFILIFSLYSHFLTSFSLPHFIHIFSLHSNFAQYIIRPITGHQSGQYRFSNKSKKSAKNSNRKWKNLNWFPTNT